MPSETTERAAEIPHPIFLDLKPNRMLLDPKFDGYKLTLEPLPIYTTRFPNGVDKVGPAEDQYSIQHVKLFGLYNCLHGDPFNASLALIVDKEWNVHKIHFNAEERKFENQGNDSIVWQIPSKSDRSVGRHNVSVLFPSDNDAVIGDGCGTVFILETGNREKNTEWKLVYEIKDIEEQSVKKLDKFTVQDAKAYKIQEEEFMDILLMRLHDAADPEISEFLEKNDQFSATSRKHPFVTKLNWITLKKENSNWDYVATRTLVGPSGVDYGCLEDVGTGVLLASENQFAYYHVSNEPLKYKDLPKKKTVLNQPDKPDYVWMQNENEITLLFKIPIGVSRSNINVDIKASFISVSLNGAPMLEGGFLHKVKPNETAIWTINPISVTDEESQEDGDVSSSNPDDGSAQIFYQSLEIVFQKDEKTIWEGDSIVKGNSSTIGQQISDPEFVANIQERLNHLCSDKWSNDPLRATVCDSQQLEECDGLPADTNSFMRIDRSSQSISHVASLGGHQWLFSARINGSQKVPAICIRHDVDGLIWQPPEFDGHGTYALKHIGTFSAMGYVQASKQQRKFTVCPPDMSYVAICDSVKHVYLYQQPNLIETDLRNRKTGHIVSHIAKQYVISLDPPLEILGVVATDGFLLILTSQNVHAVHFQKDTDE